MPIIVGWLNDEKRVMWFRLKGTWTTAEVMQGHREAMNLVDSVKHRVDFLVDLSENEQTLPRGIFEIGQQIAADNRPNLGYYALLGGWPILSTVTATLRRLDDRIAKRTYFVKSQAEALDLFQNLEG